MRNQNLFSVKIIYNNSFIYTIYVYENNSNTKKHRKQNMNTINQRNVIN